MVDPDIRALAVRAGGGTTWTPTNDPVRVYQSNDPRDKLVFAVFTDVSGPECSVDADCAYDLFCDGEETCVAWTNPSASPNTS
jgi:hypothetical protein